MKRTIFDVPWAASSRSSVTSQLNVAAAPMHAAAAAAEEVAEQPVAENVAEGLEDVADVVEMRRRRLPGRHGRSDRSGPASPDG